MPAPTYSIGVPVRKAVMDAFAGHLAQDSAFNGGAAAERETSVSFGYQFGRQDLTEQVYTGRSRADTPPAAMRSGRNARQETGTFDVNVMVRFVGGDGYDAELRAEQIGGAFESWVADRKNGEGLDVDGLQTLVVLSWQGDYAQIDGGSAALRTYQVRWTARLE